MSNLTVEAFRAWSKSDTSPDTSVIQDAIDAAEESVNDHCAREFVVAHASTTSARLFVPRGDDVLLFDDAVAVTSITINGTVVSSSDYQLEPVNGRTTSGLSVPYHQARLIGQCWPTEHGKAIASVVARWGWTTLPDKYMQSVQHVTKDMLDLAETRGGVLNFGEYGPMVLRENKYVVGLLSKLRRVESWGIA